MFYNSDAGTALYDLLELEKGANQDDIKRSYRRLALRFHPDKNPDDATAADKFKDINKAHKILSDPTKKRIYDEHGSLGLHIAESFGEENVKYYFIFSSWWCKALFGVSCILTGCYCCCCLCCCCNCCCGRCAPKIDEDDIPNAEDLAAEEEADSGNKSGAAAGSPITAQPTATASPKKAESPNGNGSNANTTPIALGPPPPASSAPIVLGPPPPTSTTNANERSELTSSSPSKRYSSTDNNW
ncbi:unnamed protein product [Orchesella dallaii]|uniref:J domain-containing protein n=1 Tax=Orchesella dallaii TaxID=48710 RepID=A0ABP1QU49_9HEXA